MKNSNFVNRARWLDYICKDINAMLLSRSLISILDPLLATALYSLVGLKIVIAFDFGSFIVIILTKPKNRMKVIYTTMLFSMRTENFMLAFCREPWHWCMGQVIGWVLVPVMSATYDPKSREIYTQNIS